MDLIYAQCPFWVCAIGINAISDLRFVFLACENRASLTEARLIYTIIEKRWQVVLAVISQLSAQRRYKARTAQSEDIHYKTCQFAKNFPHSETFSGLIDCAPKSMMFLL